MMLGKMVMFGIYVKFLWCIYIYIYIETYIYIYTYVSLYFYLETQILEYLTHKIGRSTDPNKRGQLGSGITVHIAMRKNNCYRR